MTAEGSSPCYFCSSTEEIEEHHIVPQRFAGSDADSNIVDVCHGCHWKLERLYNKDFWEAIGIEDPRATREKHITCDMHGCTEPATDSYGISGTTGSAHVYRCDEHDPTDPQPERERKEQPEESELDGGRTSVEQLEYIFETTVDDPPVKKTAIIDVLGNSNRINSINVLNEGPELHLLVRSGTLEVHIEAQDGAWRITQHEKHPDAIIRPERMYATVERIIEESESESSPGVSDGEIYTEALEAGLSELDVRHSLTKLLDLCRINPTPEGQYTTKGVEI